PFEQRELDVDAGVRDLAVALGDDLVLGETGGAAGAPGHRVVALVYPAVLPAALEEEPDGVVVLVGVRVVAVVPVHPVAEADRLLGLDGGEALHAVLALLHELVDAELEDVLLR